MSVSELSTVVVWSAFSWGLLGLTPPASAETPPSAPTHKEQVEDEYLPGPVRSPIVRGAGRTTWTRGTYTSVQVNVDAYGGNIPGDAANEPSIAIDPTEPRRIVIGWHQFDTVASNFRQAGWAFSHDGGHTWTFPGVIEPGVFRSDPVLDADAEGNFYYNSLTTDFVDFWCHVFKSSDGGQTWDSGTYAFGGDKAWMTIDRTDGIGRGNIYASWTQSLSACPPGHFTRSYDGGETYADCTTVPGTPRWGTLAVGPDGELYVSGEGFFVAKSTTMKDETLPAAWDFSTTVDLGGSAEGWAGPNPAGLLGQVWIAVDHSDGPTRGNVYLLCSVNPPGPDPLDVMFVRSIDGGQNWSAPVRVNDDPTENGAWQWFGTMSVAGDGRIDVIWNDTRNDPTATFSEVYYAYSPDGGVSWSANEPVSPAFNHSLGYPSQDKLGDYYHMTSDGLGANLAYAATFNGEQDVYFLRIGSFDCNANEIEDELDIAAGTSEDCDSNGVPDECEPDCNGNGQADSCDVFGGTSEDCNSNGRPDECELATLDCNTNGYPDECDIAAGTSSDCNANGSPDECDVAQVDCNTNGYPDGCDVAAGTSGDCNANGRPDECDVASSDCNTNGYPDDCDISFGTSWDCKANGIPDECEATAPDCNSNGVPDSCDVGVGTSEDCNGNEIPDECDLAAGTSRSCNNNGIPDECDIEDCPLGTPACDDCNYNAIPDECDLASGTSLDGDTNGVPDECEFECVGAEYAKLRASDATGGDNLGHSVSVSADLAVVGASRDDDNGSGSGSAYVYRYGGSTWVEEAKLTASDGATEDWFGGSVSVSGDLAIIGAYQDDDNGSSSGSAYVYRYDGPTWVEEAKLTASDGATDDEFGGSVSVYGDLAVIGAPGDDVLTGSAYVYRHDGSGWVEEAKLIAADGASHDSFGVSVSVAGDLAVIGAPGDNGTGGSSGSAYVYRYNGSGWVEETRLTASDEATGNAFGFSVSVSGDLALVGAFGDDANGSSSGSAYVYRYDGSAWVEEAKLTASDGASYDFFGRSVSVSGDLSVIGAYQDDDNGNNSGSAYVYRYDGSRWVEEAKLIASDGTLWDVFGVAVSVSGSRAVIGAPGDDDNGSASGSAYVVRGLLNCNSNGSLDVCDVASQLSSDCQSNGVPDECDLAAGSSADCNTNQTPDECDIVFGTSADEGSDGVPDECQVRLAHSSPQHGETLWRARKNFIRLTFDADITAPDDNDLRIELMNSNGAFGTLYTTSTNGSEDFLVTVNTNSVGERRMLDIREDGSTLTNRTWITVRNTGDWGSVEPFYVHYVVQMGDVDNDGHVLFADISDVIPALGSAAAQDDRKDVDGQGQVLFDDITALVPFLGNAPVDKPAGHEP